MEGISGIERSSEIFQGLDGYELGRRLMAGDANAVIKGAIEGGATEIVVADSHGYMCNIRPSDLHPNVMLRSGMLRRTQTQAKGLNGSFDAFMMVGFHAKAGSDAILAHTWIPGFLDVRVNHHSVPEPVMNAWYAGSLGVPTIFLSGDDVVIKESRDHLGEIEYVATKVSRGVEEGIHRPLSENRADLRAGARRAVESLLKRSPTILSGDVGVEVDLQVDPFATTFSGLLSDQNRRFIDREWGDDPINDVDLMLATHPWLTIQKPGKFAFSTVGFKSAYLNLKAMLDEIYERDIQNLVDEQIHTVKYVRPELVDIIGDYPVLDLPA